MNKILIVGPSSQILGVRIAKELGVEYINTEFKTFPDGENYIRLNIDVNNLIDGKDVIIVHSTGPSTSGNQNARIFELFMILDSVKRLKAKKVTVIIPYFAYARQDKIFRPGESIFGDLLVRLIDSMGIDELFVVDIHAPEILKDTYSRTVNIDSMRALADYIKSLGAKDIVVVAPDKGAVDRSKAFAKHFGENIPVDFFEKKRDVKTGEITMSGRLSLNDKDVVISDDIIATGGTMATAIKLSKESGAKRIYAVATHALLLQNAKYRILDAGADEIIGTDTIDNEVAKVSMAKTIANYIK